MKAKVRPGRGLAKQTGATQRHKTIMRLTFSNIDSLAGNYERAFQSNLTAAHADRKLTGLDHAFAAIVDQRHLPRCDRERHAAFFSREKRNAIEPDQRSNRHRRGGRSVRQIQLDHLVAFSIAGIRHVNTYLHRFTSLHRLRLEAQIAVSELRIAQAITKRIKRL